MDTSHILLEIYDHMKTLHEACLKWKWSILHGLNVDKLRKLEENLEHMKFIYVIKFFSAQACG